MENVIEISSLYHSYGKDGGKLRVLRGVDLNVRRGELLVIYGKSGSGKTTLLNIIAGYIKPDAGRVRVLGNDILSMSDFELSKFRNRNIGFIFQQFFLINYLTCEENIQLPGYFSKFDSSWIRKRTEEMLRVVELDEFRNYYPPMLSGGQQQRVSIARAIFLNPAILLCDEPIGNLDSETGTKMVRMFKELNLKQKVTVIIVSHEEEISNVADRIAYLRDGKLVDEKDTGNKF